MSVDKVRADYEQLTQIAQAFGQLAEALQQTLGRLEKDKGVLEGGKWKGKGSAAFYREMNQTMLPAMKRLAAAMNSAANTTTKISRIMKQAEGDAARLFRLARTPERGSGGATRARGPAGASAFNFDWDDVVQNEGERYTPPPNGPTPPPNPGGKVVKIEHGNRLTREQVKEWRQQHPTAPIRRVDKTSSRHPKHSEEQLKKDGFYKARTNFDDDKKIKTEIWLKDKKQDFVNGKGEAVLVRRSWEGNSIYKRVPPGPGFYKDYDDLSLNWFSSHGLKPRNDRLGNKPGAPITVEQFWDSGYYYATTEIQLDPIKKTPVNAREFWINDYDGTFIQVDNPLP